MFKHGQMSKTLSIILAWITLCTSSYALGLSSTDMFGHIVFNFMLSRVAATLPATVIMFFTVNRFGRVKTLGISHIMLGIFCLGLAFIPKDQKMVVVVTYVTAHIFVGLGKCKIDEYFIKWQVFCK